MFDVQSVLLLIPAFKSIEFVNPQLMRRPTVAQYFNFFGLGVHPVKQRQIPSGPLPVPLAVDNEQRIPPGMLVGRKPEAILAVPVIKGSGDGIRSQIDGQLAGCVETMAEYKGHIRVRHPHTDAFHLPGDARPAE